MGNSPPHLPHTQSPPPRKPPPCQLILVGTRRLVYMLHPISRESGISDERANWSRLTWAVPPAGPSTRYSPL